MTFEERFDRLVERHEALAQTVEILAAENRQTAAENRERDRRLGEIMEGIARLLHVAEIHEHRTRDLKAGGPEPVLGPQNQEPILTRPLFVVAGTAL